MVTILGLTAVSILVKSSSSLLRENPVFATLEGILGELLGAAVGEKIAKWKSERPTFTLEESADVEKCSRDALLNGLVSLLQHAKENIQKSLTMKENEYLTEAIKSLKRQHKLINGLKANDPLLKFDPATQFENVPSLLLPVESDEKSEQLRSFLTEYVLNDVLNIQEQHFFRSKMYDWVHNGFPVQGNAKKKHWFDVYCLAFTGNLNKEFPEYCKNAAKTLNRRLLVEIFETSRANTEVVNRTFEAVWGNYYSIKTSIEFLREELVEHLRVQKTQPHQPIEELIASNKVEHTANLGEDLFDKVLQVINFRSRAISFVGREKEIEALEIFLDSEPIFSWWGLIGAGGTGKSRMALDIALRKYETEDWTAGFVDNNKLRGFDWNDWDINAPTLLLIDYAGAEPNVVRQTLRNISNRRSKFSHRVRVLLMERDEKKLEDWWSRLAEDEVLVNYSHQQKPQSLDKLDRELLWNIITDTLALFEKPHPHHDTTLSLLQEIDPLGRPLFAVFLAVVIAEGGELGKITRQQDVLEALYKLNKRIWQKGANNNVVSDRYLNLQALVTLCHGLQHEEWDQLQTLDSKILPTAETIWNDTLWETLCPSYDDKLAMHSLQPDIFGEYVILRRLNELQKGKIQLGKKLTDMAWEIRPQHTATVIQRMAKDFPTELMKHTYLFQSEGIVKNRITAKIWCSLGIALVYYLNPDEGILIYNRYKALAKIYPEENIQNEQAKALVILIHGLAEIDLVRAFAVYEDMKALAQKPDNQEILIRQAESLDSLILFVASNDLPTAYELYEELKALAQATDNTEILIEQAGSLRTIIFNVAKNDMPNALALYEELKALATDNPKILDRQAQALDYLIFNAAKNDMQHALTLYEELTTLATNNPKILYRLAQALNSLIIFVGVNDLPRACGLYEELKRLAQRTDNSEMPIQQAETLGRLIFKAAKKDLPRALALYEELKALATDHPKKLDLQAKALADLIPTVAKADLARATELYKDLRNLVLKIGNPEQLVEPMKALFKTIVSIGDIDFTTAYGLYKSLNTDNPEVLVELAQNLFWRIFFVGKSNPPGAVTLVKELKTLAFETGSPKILNLVATALDVQVVHFLRTNPPGALASYEELRTLALTTDSPEILARQERKLSLIMYQIEQSDPSDIIAWHKALKALALTTDNPEILLLQEKVTTVM